MNSGLSSQEVKARVLAEAKALGFDAFGVAPIDVELRKEYFRKWIASGMHGSMAWMDNPKRLDPKLILPEAQSILCFGFNYYQEKQPGRTQIARYALGGDYHKVILKKLKHICKLLQELGGIQKPYVDTGPVMERPIAEQAGLGWQGKSGMVLNKEQGTWMFLGTIITTLKLPEDAPHKSYCGKCTACIDACPTGAIIAPYKVDSRKCLAYLSIENKGPIPEEFREAMGGRVYGCDVCSEVCPWNRWAQTTREIKFAARQHPDLREMLSWDDETFLKAFEGTPIRRIKRVRWLRNICVVLGNIGSQDDLPALVKAAEDPDPLVCDHAQWAISRIKSRIASASSW